MWRSYQDRLSVLDEVLQDQARHRRVQRSTVVAAILLLAAFTGLRPATVQPPPPSARTVPTGAPCRGKKLAAGWFLPIHSPGRR